MMRQFMDKDVGDQLLQGDRPAICPFVKDGAAEKPDHIGVQRWIHHGSFGQRRAVIKPGQLERVVQIHRLQHIIRGEILDPQDDLRRCRPIGVWQAGDGAMGQLFDQRKVGGDGIGRDLCHAQNIGAGRGFRKCGETGQFAGHVTGKGRQGARQMSAKTVTRFAPSPTGYIHVGNLRTALMNYLIAKKSGGQFILRLDDTDQERSKQEYADAIMADLEWLGLHWDRVERQSLRLERYREAAEDLKAKGRFYEVFESPTELDLKRKKQLNMGKPPVYDRSGLHLSAEEKEKLRAEGRAGYWRFLLDQERIEWTDGILGPISIDAASVSDPVLIRADGQVLYTFASSVDDIDMGVSFIVRGADHVTNTATQIQIMQAMGGTPPNFAHHSLLTGAKGEELSKRLGTLSLRDLRARGVEPMALLSLMSRLGSSKPVELIGSMEDLIEGFDIGTFGAAPTKFDAEDLFPLTRAYVQGRSFDEVASKIADLGVPADKAQSFWDVAKGNITVLSDMEGWWALFRDGATPVVDEADRDFVAEAFALLPAQPWTKETWGEWTAAVKAATGRKGKDLFRPLRRAMTGLDAGPEMADVMPMLPGVPKL